jgi:glycogen debranching enzyme
MAMIATTIGRDADVARWRNRAEVISERLVAQLWDDSRGLFASTHDGLAIPVDTPFGLLPLLSGRLPAPIARRLVATLLDPDRFWTPFPAPTVAANDPGFDPGQMWRGPVWLNVNRLLIEGLRRSAFPAEAAMLRERTLALALGQPDFPEYYHPLTGALPRRAAPMFGWAAASFLDLAVEPSS